MLFLYFHFHFFSFSHRFPPYSSLPSLSNLIALTSFLRLFQLSLQVLSFLFSFCYFVLSYSCFFVLLFVFTFRCLPTTGRSFFPLLFCFNMITPFYRIPRPFIYPFMSDQASGALLKLSLLSPLSSFSLVSSRPSTLSVPVLFLNHFNSHIRLHLCLLIHSLLLLYCFPYLFTGNFFAHKSICDDPFILPPFLSNFCFSFPLTSLKSRFLTFPLLSPLNYFLSSSSLAFVPQTAQLAPLHSHLRQLFP